MAFIAVPADRWRRVLSSRGPATALMDCPRCGREGLLDLHDIAPNGEVRPSVVCPHAGCDFHDFVRLDGWGLAAQREA